MNGRNNLYHRVLAESANTDGARLAVLDVTRIFEEALRRENELQQHDAAQRIEDEENEYT